jgi:hypothetical protein
MSVILTLFGLVISFQLIGLYVPAWVNFAYFALILFAAGGLFSNEARDFARAVLTFVGTMVFLCLVAFYFLVMHMTPAVSSMH